MAKQRYVSTSFWDDGWVQTLDPSEKLLYLYLMTNPLTNIAGVYKITDRRISFDTGFNLETVKMILSKFEAKGKAFRFNEYIAIPSWPKHQEWEKRQKIRDGIVSELQNLPDDVIEFLDDIDYQFDLSLIEKIIIARKQRKGISGTTVKKLRIKYENKCARCGGDSDLQIHHIVPIKEGGDNSFDNLTLLCIECHKTEHQSKKVQIGYVDNFGHETQSTPVHNYSDSDSDIDSDIDSDLCRPEGGEPLPAVIVLPKLGGKEFAINQEQVDTFTEAYPAVNIMAELKKMKAWLVANPKNMKKDVLRFANNWLSRENDKRGNRPNYGRQKAIGRVSTESGSLQTSPDDYNSL